MRRSGYDGRICTLVQFGRGSKMAPTTPEPTPPKTAQITSNPSAIPLNLLEVPFSNYTP
jgi:hypothetical protein